MLMKTNKKIIVIAFFVYVLMSLPMMILAQEEDKTEEEEKEERNTEREISMLIGGAIGIILFIFIYGAWYVVNMRRARLRRPFVVMYNPIERSVQAAGRFTQINNMIPIPVTNSTHKTFWALETDYFVILPAYGSENDLIIQDRLRGAGTLKIMECEIIGTSADGEDIVKEWAKYAFPSSAYSIPPQLDMTSVPPNYIFVRPIYKREWGPIIHRRGLASARNIYGEVTRLINIADREQEVIHDSWGRLLATQIQSATEMIITMYYNALKLWDTISEQRVLPWEVYGRLLHIDMDQLNYSGLRQAVQGGNIHEVGADVIRGFRDMLDKVGNEFGLTMVSTPVYQMLRDKTGQLQEQVTTLAKRDFNNQANLRKLVQQMDSYNQVQPQPAPNQQNPERPVLQVYRDQ